MADFEVTSPDGKKFIVSAPDGATQDQVLAYAQSQWRQPAEPPLGDRAGRVAGLGARALITGVTAVPTLMAEAVAAPLRALSGGKYFPSPSATLQQGLTDLGLPEPANTAERLSTGVTSAMAGGGATQLAARATQPVTQVGRGVRDLLIQQPGRQAVAAGTGAASSQVAGELGAGPVGQFAAGLLGGLAPFAPQMMAGRMSPEQLQTAQTAAMGREAGLVAPPSQFNPSITNKLLGGFSGQARTDQAASLKNQAQVNAIARSDLGLPKDAPLNQATLEAYRSRVSGPYREVEALLPNGKQLMDDLRAARMDATDHWKFYNQHPDPAVKAKAIQAGQAADQIEATFDAAAQSAGKPGLLESLRGARTQIAKSYDYDRALNENTGNIDPSIIGRSADKGSPQTGGMKTIGSFANAFPNAMRSMDGKQPPFMSVLDGFSAAAPLAGAMMSQQPEVAALSMLPFLRPPVRAAILSKPYQALAAPNLSPLNRPDAAPLGVLQNLYNQQ